MLCFYNPITISIKQVFIGVQELLSNPNPDSPANGILKYYNDY